MIDGIEVFRVWLYPATGRNPIKRLANYLTFTFTATMYLFFRMRNIDVLFVEGQPISMGIAGIFMKWFRGVPYVFNIPDLQPMSLNNSAFLELVYYCELQW